jgi:hypothetical protein
MGCVQLKLQSLELPLGNNAREVEVTEKEVLAEGVPISDSNMDSRGSRLLGYDMSLKRVEPHGPTIQATTIPQSTSHSTEEQALAFFNKLKEEHDIAKAVRYNNAKIPVHLWDEGVVGQELTEEKRKPSQRCDCSGYTYKEKGC